MVPDIVAQRIVEYGDGWIPLDGGHELEPTIDAIRKEADRAGRTLDEFELIRDMAGGGCWLFREAPAE